MDYTKTNILVQISRKAIILFVAILLTSCDPDEFIVELYSSA